MRLERVMKVLGFAVAGWWVGTKVTEQARKKHPELGQAGEGMICGVTSGLLAYLSGRLGLLRVGRSGALMAAVGGGGLVYGKSWYDEWAAKAKAEAANKPLGPALPSGPQYPMLPQIAPAAPVTIIQEAAKPRSTLDALITEGMRGIATVGGSLLGGQTGGSSTALSTLLGSRGPQPLTVSSIFARVGA